jgi:outer membrane protein assembly factor BamB
MTVADTAEPTLRRPLRLWPGVAAVVLGWLVMLVLPRVAPTAAMYGVLAGVASGLLVLVWWLFFSRAPWSERLGALVLIVLATFAMSRLVHESLAGAGMGVLIYIYAVPVLALALVVGALVGRRRATGPRRAAIFGAILLACAALTLVRLDGMDSRGGVDFEWRWTPTAEERILADAAEDLAEVPAGAPVASSGAPADSGPAERDSVPAVAGADASPAGADAADAEAAAVVADGDSPAAALRDGQRGGAAASDTPMTPAEEGASAPTSVPAGPHTAEWPGFRGPARDGVVSGVRIATDWSQSPPVELWRRPVGPGWSSFAVDGDRFYTQEQLGEHEIVSCYHLESGRPVWRHRDEARFWEANAGAGPRATPTLHGGRVYAFGATGILNALDARDGSVVWSRNVATDTDIEVPYWGFSASPVLIGDLVVVAAAGTLAAYDVDSGDLRWEGPEGNCCYSSPHLATIDGVTQILLLNGRGAISVAPEDGTVLWKHEWPGDGIVQPAVTEDGDVLIGTGSGMGGPTGIRRVAVAPAPGEWSAERGSGGWTVEERWTSAGLKPYFSDFVMHEGHAYGFDGGILAAIDLADGKRKWKGGRYGDGQLVLLADQDLLLVLSERGDLALVDATPAQFTERARHSAIEGKTWNHPVLAGDVVLVRNSEEMAAFRLSLEVR